MHKRYAGCMRTSQVSSSLVSMSCRKRRIRVARPPRGESSPASSLLKVTTVRQARTERSIVDRTVSLILCYALAYPQHRSPTHTRGVRLFFAIGTLFIFRILIICLSPRPRLLSTPLVQPRRPPSRIGSFPQLPSRGDPVRSWAQCPLLRHPCQGSQAVTHCFIFGRTFSSRLIDPDAHPCNSRQALRNFCCAITFLDSH